MKHDSDYLSRIADALERIADAQEAMVSRPAPLRTAEKRLEVAIEANDKAIASAVEDTAAGSTFRQVGVTLISAMSLCYPVGLSWVALCDAMLPSWRSFMSASRRCRYPSDSSLPSQPTNC